MDRLDNEEIGIIWARHYPKRAENGSSKSLCLSLAMVIRLRARSMTQQSDWSDKLEQYPCRCSNSQRTVCYDRKRVNVSQGCQFTCGGKSFSFGW